jgi:hypothetical protein
VKPLRVYERVRGCCDLLSLDFLHESHKFFILGLAASGLLFKIIGESSGPMWHIVCLNTSQRLPRQKKVKKLSKTNKNGC